MIPNKPVPHMRLTTNPRPTPPKVRRGKSMEQVRGIWRVRSEAKTKEIMDKYTKQ